MKKITTLPLLFTILSLFLLSFPLEVTAGFQPNSSSIQKVKTGKKPIYSIKKRIKNKLNKSSFNNEKRKTGLGLAFLGLLSSFIAYVFLVYAIFGSLLGLIGAVLLFIVSFVILRMTLKRSKSVIKETDSNKEENKKIRTEAKIAQIFSAVLLSLISIILLLIGLVFALN